MLKNILENFVFNPDKTIYNDPSSINISFENIFLSNSEDNSSSIFNKYHGWFIENNNDFNKELSNFVVLYFHGNAGNISTRINFIKKLYLTGFSIMIFDYPGFGLSDGYPNEESCINCAHLFYNFLHNTKKYSKKKIIFYGESIGGSIASSLALKTNIKYLILHSTFTNISLIIKQFIYIPSIIIEQIGFNTIDNLKKRYKLNIIEIKKSFKNTNLNNNINNSNENSNLHITNENNLVEENKRKKDNHFKLKTLVIHSKEDELIPYIHAINLSKYCTDFYECEGKHSSPKINKEFLDKIIDFII